MSELLPVDKPVDTGVTPHGWLGLVLDHFARGEQAIGQLSLALGLPISNGSLSSLNEILNRLQASGDRKAKALEKRITRWSANRPKRHLLAHATIFVLKDSEGQQVLVTRHLPRDANDVTPDRMWTVDERAELFRQASNDSRSICDHVRNILADPVLLNQLRKD